MWGFVKRLMGGASANPMLVGVWAPVAGNPKETIEYGCDGSVRMAMFGGVLHMTGRYTFLDNNTIQIDWDGRPSADATAVVGTLNKSLANQGLGVQARIVTQTVLEIDVNESELKTLHVEKGRRCHFRRVDGTLAP